MEQRYKLVTKAYLGKGKDGYDSLAKAEVNLHQYQPNKQTLKYPGDGWRRDSSKPDLRSAKPLPSDQNEAGQGVCPSLLAFIIHTYMKTIKLQKTAWQPLLLLRLGRAESVDPPPIVGDPLEENLRRETARERWLSPSKQVLWPFNRRSEWSFHWAARHWTGGKNDAFLSIQFNGGW